MALSAAINSPQADGYLTRAENMLDDANYQGVIDQLTILDELNPSFRQQCDADRLRAIAASEAGMPEAETLLRSFIARWPQSPEKPEMELRLASLPFFAGDWNAALDMLNAIDSSTLEPDAAETLAYRTAYCQMQLGDYGQALRTFTRLSGSKRYGNAATFYRGYIAYAEKRYDEAETMLKQADTSSAPGNMADYYLAQIYFQRKDYRSALAKARPLAVQSGDEVPFAAEASRLTGESLFNLGDEAQAIPYLRRYASETEQPLPSTLYILGLADYRAGNYAEAIATLTPVADEPNATGQGACLLIGQSYLQQDNNAAALLALDRARRADYDPEVTETAFFNYAVARINGGRIPFGSSVDTFEEFLRRYPDSRHAAEVQDYIVTGYITDNDYDAALRSIDAIKRPGRKVLAAKQRVLLVLGARALAAGDARTALDRLNGSLALASHNADIAAEATLWQADAYYRLGEYANAERSYKVYLNKAPRKAENRQLATYGLAYAQFARRDYRAARSNFQSVVQDSSQPATTRADAWNRIADTYYYTSDFKSAREAYDKAYAAAPESGDYALFQKGMMRGLERDHRAKITAMDDLAAKFPSSALIPSALLEKAQALVALGRNSDAIEAYRNVINRYPATAQGRNALLQLASTYRNAGNTEAAVATYREVITKYPTGEEAAIAVDDLKAIAVESGDIRELDRFLNSVPGAPQLDAAEKNTLASRSLYRQASEAIAKGNTDVALAKATEIVTSYPDSEQAEDALAIKADIEFNDGKAEMALADYLALEQRASGSSMIARARIGALRSARDLGRSNQVIELADRILASSASGTAGTREVRFARACALADAGRTAEAEAQWNELAARPDELYGAMSAYHLAQHYFDAGDSGKATTAVNGLIDSNTPQQYWLARGFVLLSDILRSKGNDFEADEYLKSLKSNYPGKEADIFEMINRRLKQ